MHRGQRRWLETVRIPLPALQRRSCPNSFVSAHGSLTPRTPRGASFAPEHFHLVPSPLSPGRSVATREPTPRSLPGLTARGDVRSYLPNTRRGNPADDVIEQTRRRPPPRSGRGRCPALRRNEPLGSGIRHELELRLCREVWSRVRGCLTCEERSLYDKRWFVSALHRVACLCPVDARRDGGRALARVPACLSGSVRASAGVTGHGSWVSERLAADSGRGCRGVARLGLVPLVS